MSYKLDFVTFVIPVFHSQGTLRELSQRIANQMEDVGLPWEILFIMDGDGIAAWEDYTKDIPENLPVRAIRLSRNFGQHRAIRFGIQQAREGIVFIMDCDLQDPPEIIPEVLAPVMSGAVDVVYTSRTGQYKETSGRAIRSIYSRLAAAVTGLEADKSLGPVIAISSRTVPYVNSFREDAHILQILRWLSLPHTTIEYVRQTRNIGRSSYTLTKRISHAIRGLAFSANRFMAVVFTLSFVAAFSSLVLMVILAIDLAQGNPPSGWLSLMCVTILGYGLGGMLLSVIGGLLIEVLNIGRQRPPTVVAETWPADGR